VRRLLDWTTIALFALALLAPAVDQCLREDVRRDCSAAEMRRPEPRPAFPRQLAELTAFPRRYESHYMDTFGLRDVLLRWNSLQRYLGLGLLPSSTWEPGREGWCFYLGGDSREVFRGLKPLTPADLDGWVRRLRERRDFLAERGARYLFVLCPNKQTIYPELTPDTWAPLGPTRMDQLVERLAREGDVPFLDLRPALLAAKADDRPDDWLYTPLGTHWNGRGTYAAYAAIVARLRADFPALPLVRREDCRRFDPDDRPDGLGHQLYIDDKLAQPVYTLLPAAGKQYQELVRSANHAEGSRLVTQKELDAPRLLWAHDSFGPYLQPLMCESFAYVQAHWNQVFPVEAVDEARPDVVLETYVERILAIQEPYRETVRSVPALAAQFEASSEVLWRDDAAFPPAQSLGEATVERRDGSLYLTRHGMRDGLLLPALEATGAGPVLLRLAATCNALTDVDVFVRSGPGQFVPRNGAHLQLGPAVESAVVSLPFVGSPFETLLRPRPPASTLAITALELRRGPAPKR